MVTQLHRRPGTRGLLTGSAIVASFFISLCPCVLISAPPDHGVPVFRRMLLRPEQLPAELERVRKGALRHLALTDFDDLVPRAGDPTAPRRDPPRLVETRFRAALVGEALVG